MREIVDLIPSKDLKEAIKNMDWKFSEVELIKLAYNLAESQDQRLQFLSRMSVGFSESYSRKLASDLLDFERRKYDCFVRDGLEYYYDIVIYETPRTVEQRYSCRTYDEVKSFIELYIAKGNDEEEWKEDEKIKYVVQKRKFRHYKNCDDINTDEIGYFEFGKGGVLKETNIFMELDAKCRGECFNCRNKCPNIKLFNFVIKFPKVFKKYDIVSYDDYYYNDRYSEKEYFLLLKGNTAKDEEAYCIPLELGVFAYYDTEEYFYTHRHEKIYKLEKAHVEDLEPKKKELYIKLLTYLKKKKSEAERLN